MEKSKLTNRLRIFSAQEMKDFILFADSPYFNSNAALTRLLKYLQKYHPDLKSKKLSKELVYKKIFPEKGVFKEKRLNDLMSHLFKLSEDFLAFNRFKKSPVARSKQEFLSYRERGMNKDFSKTAVKLKRAIEAAPANEEYHFELFLLNKELFIEQGEDKVQSLNAVFHHLDQYFIQEKLLFAAFAKNREKYMKEQYEVNYLDVFTDKQLITADLAIYFSNLRQVIATEDIETIKSLIGDFKRHKEKLSQRLSYCLLILILNILMRKLQEDENKVTSVIFNLYKFAVDENFILFNNKINDSTFANICIIAEKMEERVWQKDFILNYQDKVFPIENRQNTISFVRAFILFNQAKDSMSSKKIAEAIIEMNTLSFTDFRYTYTVRIQLIKLHFNDFLLEKNYESFDFLTNFCKNFENQLYRDYKISNPRVTMYLNFSKSVKKLATYIFDKKNEKIIELKEQIMSLDSLFARQWLNKKIGEAIVS